jgi:phasin
MADEKAANDDKGAKDTGTKAEIPAGLREAAEKSVEHARTAVGSLLEAARGVADSIQTGAKTSDTSAGQAVTRGFGFAKENIGAIFDFAQKIVKAPDLKTAAEMQSEFVKAQAATMQKQVEELKGLTPTPTAKE